MPFSPPLPQPLFASPFSTIPFSSSPFPQPPYHRPLFLDTLFPNPPFFSLHNLLFPRTFIFIFCRSLKLNPPKPFSIQPLVIDQQTPFLHPHFPQCSNSSSRILLPWHLASASNSSFFKSHSEGLHLAVDLKTKLVSSKQYCNEPLFAFHWHKIAHSCCSRLKLPCPHPCISCCTPVEFSSSYMTSHVSDDFCKWSFIYFQTCQASISTQNMSFQTLHNLCPPYPHCRPSSPPNHPHARLNCDPQLRLRQNSSILTISWNKSSIIMRIEAQKTRFYLLWPFARHIVAQTLRKVPIKHLPWSICRLLNLYKPSPSTLT